MLLSRSCCPPHLPWAMRLPCSKLLLLLFKSMKRNIGWNFKKPGAQKFNFKKLIVSPWRWTTYQGWKERCHPNSSRMMSPQVGYRHFRPFRYPFEILHETIHLTLIKATRQSVQIWNVNLSHLEETWVSVWSCRWVVGWNLRLTRCHCPRGC